MAWILQNPLDYSFQLNYMTKKHVSKKKLSKKIFEDVFFKKLIR